MANGTGFWRSFPQILNRSLIVQRDIGHETLGLRIEKFFYLKTSLADPCKTFLTGFPDLADEISL